MNELLLTIFDIICRFCFLFVVVKIISFICRIIGSIQDWILLKTATRKSLDTEIEIPKPIQFNIKREPIRLTFDNIEYFEIRDGEVVRDKFEDEIVEYETELIMTILNGYQYKKVLKQ